MDVVVGTPGRVIDLINRNVLKMGEVSLPLIPGVPRVLPSQMPPDLSQAAHR